ncbi:MAG: hypothetical protein HQK53_18185 [Oligoflexia bacterium]|nr:hypothetical protein [Oligoflexia bacterium]
MGTVNSNGTTTHVNESGVEWIDVTNTLANIADAKAGAEGNEKITNDTKTKSKTATTRSSKEKKGVSAISSSDSTKSKLRLDLDFSATPETYQRFMQILTRINNKEIGRKVNKEEFLTKLLSLISNDTTCEEFIWNLQRESLSAEEVNSILHQHIYASPSEEISGLNDFRAHKQ